MFCTKSNLCKSLPLVIFLFVYLGIAQEKQDFTLFDENSISTIFIDKTEEKVVSIAASLLLEDIYAVSGKKTRITHTLEGTPIIAGTIESSKAIQKLIRQNKIDVTEIDGKWETYKIQVVQQPTPNIQKALVIVGSDKRGTAYGLLEISRMMGVSAWEWWADVTPDKTNTIKWSVSPTVYGEPTVKYRGIFLNDEDWGLQKWAAVTYEPKTGDIGPKTYAKVFELLLRLKANTIWPAMHSCTKAFYHYPENKKVADDYAIVVGSSHAEPMLCNINAEWNHQTMGEYRYDTNATTIKGLFTKRAKETANYEGLYTLGMRGEHDSPMIVGDDDTDKQVALLENVISDQRAILKKYSKKGVEKPQVFIPYKEVLNYYQKGLQVPEDVTLIWTDDNYGYIRQLSTQEEQQRSGGAGVYYHTSYWGRPHDYLWLNSTHPMLLWEEMSKAYEFNAKQVWILNSGDIKPHEYNIQLFMDMAWDMNKFKSSEAVGEHMQQWATNTFGKSNAQPIASVMDSYYHLAFKRRPEFMAWSEVEPVTKAGETALNQYHYGDEVTHRIRSYQKLSAAVKEVGSLIPNHKKDAFFQLVEYPILGASNLNLKWLYTFKNKFVASQGRISAAHYKDSVQDAYSTIKKLTHHYNKTIENGKWNHIMNASPRALPVFSVPATMEVNRDSKDELGIALEGYQMETNTTIVNSYANVLPLFNAYTKNTYYVDLFLKGNSSISWQIKADDNWIKISKTQGELSVTHPEERIFVTIDWEHVPKGEDSKEAPLGHDYQLIPPSFKVNSSLQIITEAAIHSIGVSVFNPEYKTLEAFNGFVEDKGFISINASHYSRKRDAEYASWHTFKGLGYSGEVSVTLPRTAPSNSDQNSLQQGPYLEYDFFSFNFGEANILLQAVPTHAVSEDKGVRCAVAIDNATPVIVDFKTTGRSDKWKQNVLKNAAVASAKQIIDKAGKHTLKIWMVDPGVMLDQVLIDLGGYKSSYAFPKETKL